MYSLLLRCEKGRRWSLHRLPFSQRRRREDLDKTHYTTCGFLHYHTVSRSSSLTQQEGEQSATDPPAVVVGASDTSAPDPGVDAIPAGALTPDEFARGLLKAHNDVRFEAPKFKEMLSRAMSGNHPW